MKLLERLQGTSRARVVIGLLYQTLFAGGRCWPHGCKAISEKLESAADQRVTMEAKTFGYFHRLEKSSAAVNNKPPRWAFFPQALRLAIVRGKPRPVPAREDQPAGAALRRSRHEQLNTAISLC
jgi:hypothetical protein